MKNWIRVASVFSILVGSTALFGYWSLNQFDNALNNLSASYIAVTNTPLTSFSDKANEEQISTTTEETISTTTTEATSTAATSTPLETEFPTGSADLAGLAGLSFIFPQTGGLVYIGCTYQISVQASTTIRSFESALVDAGTGEAAGPIASGLAKENVIKGDSQSLDWKVGVVWPGEYYIKVSNANGVDLEKKSGVFTISKIPENINADEREKICKDTESRQFIQL